MPSKMPVARKFFAYRGSGVYYSKFGHPNDPDLTDFELDQLLPLHPNLTYTL